jgi:hypothetical protein
MADPIDMTSTMSERDKANHPADTLSQTLNRVASVLTTLSSMFDAQRETFVVNNVFIAQSIVTSAELVNEAQQALNNLHASCDLTLLEPVIEFESSAEISPTHNVPHEHAAEGLAIRFVPEDNSDEFAQTYLELLQKLTEAEVFAAEQQALSPPGEDKHLLPLLRSLREDVQKLHRVA